MFANFDKVFNKEKNAKVKIPDSLLAYLNKGLPEGCKYAVSKGGVCCLTSEGAEMTISGYDFVLDEQQKSLLGENFTEDVWKYSFNSQRTMKLHLIKNGVIVINGKECDVDKLVYDPYHPLNFKNGQLYIRPPKFSEPFKLVVGGNGVQYPLDITRIPNESVNIAVYESDEKKSFKIKYKIDMKQKKIVSFSITYNIRKAKSAKEIVNTVLLYNACVDGKWTINGVLCDSAVFTDNVKKYDENSIVFWNKLASIEEVMGVAFTAPEYDIDFEMICQVEELYQCLINHNPIRRDQKTISIDGKWEFDDINRLNKTINSPVVVSFEGTETIKILNVSINLHFVMAVFNGKLKSYVQKKDNYTIELDNNNLDNSMYSSIMYLKDASEANKYNNDERAKIMTELCLAKKVSEYLKEEHKKNENRE